MNATDPSGRQSHVFGGPSHVSDNYVPSTGSVSTGEILIGASIALAPVAVVAAGWDIKGAVGFEVPFDGRFECE